MKTIQFLNTAIIQQGSLHPERALQALKDKYGIKCTTYEDTLYVLNYDQINSPKDHAITKECRSLVVAVEYVGDMNIPEFVVVSRAFDRFFNYGEKKIPYKFNKLVVHEKMDGSLVTVFHDQGFIDDGWKYRTKSMIMPELPINNWDRTWKDLIETSLGEYTPKGMPRGCSFIFEVTGQENRVVVRYPEERKATLLAVRCNSTGTYWGDEAVDQLARGKGWLRPRRFNFVTVDDCIEASRHLPNLEEGYVLYKDGMPVQKIKNPAHVAAHHLRGEGLNPKRCLQLVCLGEVDEYISVFPEDEKLLAPYQDLLDIMLAKIDFKFDKIKGIADQKEFASWATKESFAGILFSMRGKGVSALEAFKALSEPAQHRLLAEFL